MFHSIRWRLILSYTALTLLTVVLVGALALALLSQYAKQRAVQSLQANAQAIAAQARPLLNGKRILLADLEQLAVTAAFLGNVQVRILDVEHRLLVDSEEATPAAGASLSLRPRSFFMPNQDSGLIFTMPPTGRRGNNTPGIMESVVVTNEDGVAGVITIHRFPGVFGNRLEFGNEHSIERPPAENAYQTEQSPPRTESIWHLIFGRETPTEALPPSTLAVTVPVGDPASPMGYVELSGGPDFVGESLRNVRRSFGAAGVGAALLAVLVGLVVSRGLTAPIVALGDAARRMGEGDLSARAPVRGSDEIGQVAERFNRMAAGLQASFAELQAERDALRRFVADASHELRTPITALKSFHELLTGQAANDPAAQAEFLAESAIQVDRLEWITANLLDLSRLDGRLVTLDLQEYDVADLLEEAAAPFHALAQERGIDLQLALPTSALRLTCDRARMVLALSNLLDNGLKYCGAKEQNGSGWVKIGADEEKGAIVLWVADNGPGIGEAEQERIFERFYRGRTHTDSGHNIPGSGLGLSIVASIVEAHGWSIRVENHVESHVESQPGNGARFIIHTRNKET